MVIGNLSDRQTGEYIARSFVDTKELGVDEVYGIDTRKIPKEISMLEAQEKIISEVKDVAEAPSIILVLKGLEIKLDTLKKIQAIYPDAIFVNWFFDKYLAEKPIWDTEKFFDVIRFYDFFFCSLKGVATKLKEEKCLPNVHYLDEACYPPFNGEVYINNFQKKKYAGDLSFIGSIGFKLQHSNRIDILKRILNDGFGLRIWGKRVIDIKYIPQELRACLEEKNVINDEHSKVVQSSLLNLGIDQDPGLDRGHSARAYRVMAAGGLYLSTATKGLWEMFKVNGPDDEITPDLDMVLFYGPEDLVQKADFLLEHDAIRESIASNGQKAVLDKHTFSDRLAEMLSIINKSITR